MQDRYALRFETGEREGEVVSLVPGALAVGRRPGSDLQILDASVSSRHAELVQDERGVLVRDLGSTNGTRVGGERVLEARLAHGDALLFGNVLLTFLDRSLVESAPAPAGGREGDALGRVSKEQLARSRRRPSAAFVLLLVLLLGGGGAAFWLTRKDGEERPSARPVVVVPGNRLDADPSFERDADGFSADPDAPVRFLESPEGRFSGSVGLSCGLGPGEWAVHRSQEVRVVAGRRLEARAALRARGEARIRLGIELGAEPRAASPAPAPAHAWSRALAAEDGWTEVTLSASVPPGYDRARLVVRAEASAEDEAASGGEAAFDDVALLEEAGTAAADLEVAEHRLFLLGEPPQEAVLYHVDRLLVSGLAFVARSSAEGALPRALELGLEPGEGGARLFAREAPAAGESVQLVLLAEPGLLEGGLGTLGQGGWRAHPATFEREGVESLLLGAERRLVGLGFEPPATARGAAAGEGARLEVLLGAPASARLELDFQAERRATDQIAREARAAEARGDLGRALASWAKLVESSPYEALLMREAEESRARLVNEGLAEVAQVADELERARFFGLVDLFRRSRAEAERIGARYAGSEVETAASALARGIDEELAARSEGRDAEESRLARIEAALRVLEAEKLAEEVRAWRERRAGDERRRP